MGRGICMSFPLEFCAVFQPPQIHEFRSDWLFARALENKHVLLREWKVGWEQVLNYKLPHENLFIDGP